MDVIKSKASVIRKHYLMLAGQIASSNTANVSKQNHYLMKPKLESQMNHLKQQMLVNQKRHQMKQKLVSRKLYATPQIY